MTSARFRLRRLYHSNQLVRAMLAVPVAVRNGILRRQAATANEIVERLAGRLPEDVMLDMPEFLGRFRCSPRSDLFKTTLVTGTYEPDFTALFRRHLDLDRDFIDVGANIGFYTVLAAKLIKTGRVLALEPVAAAHARLIENLALNAVMDRVIVFNGAAADCRGKMEIQHIEGNEEYSSLGSIIHGSVQGRKVHSAAVPVTRLDDLVERYGLRPGFIKIDVEGAEELVLKGARQTLERHRPVVLTELSRSLLGPMGTSVEAVVAWFADLGYRGVDATDSKGPIAPGPYGEVLFIPE